MDKQFQVITINPNLVDLDVAIPQIEHLQQTFPDYNIIAMVDGMTMLTMDKESLRQIRDSLTNIIGDKEESLSREWVLKMIRYLMTEGDAKMKTTDQLYGYETALTDVKKRIDIK